MPYQQIRKNQPTIVNRFGKLNPQNQQRQANDYETMKEVIVKETNSKCFFIFKVFLHFELVRSHELFGMFLINKVKAALRLWAYYFPNLSIVVFMDAVYLVYWIICYFVIRIFYFRHTMLFCRHFLKLTDLEFFRHRGLTGIVIKSLLIFKVA